MVRRSSVTGPSSSKHLRPARVLCCAQVCLPVNGDNTATPSEVAGANLAGAAATTPLQSSGDALSCEPDSQKTALLYKEPMHSF